MTNQPLIDRDAIHRIMIEAKVQRARELRALARDLRDRMRGLLTRVWTGLGLLRGHAGAPARTRPQEQRWAVGDAGVAQQ